MKKSELYDLLHDLVGDFPAGVRSNALDAAREELEAHESTQHRVQADFSAGRRQPCTASAEMTVSGPLSAHPKNR